MNFNKFVSAFFSLLVCCFWVTSINAQCISGQTVAIEGGATEITTCPGDGNADELRLITSSLATPFGFLITDENNVILDVSISNFIDFEGAGVGTCRVWAFSFAGQVLATPGQVATEATLASLCYELTDNYVTVVRTVPEGGMVTSSSGATTVSTCPGDGLADIVEFSTTSSALPYAYIITDENNIILGLPDGNSQDFEGAGIGICRVWGLAYAGNITAQMGDDITNTLLADNCHELSSTYLEVIRGEADGGTVSLSDGTTAATICAGDAEADELTFTHITNTIGASYAYVVTDDQNNIIAIPNGNTVDFNTASAGVCRVWGLAYTGSITAMPGDNAATTALADGCFDLSSNFIEVTRIEADGADVALSDGTTAATVCVGDGISDVLSFTNISNSGADYAYIITDDNNNVIGVADGNSQDFDGAGEGVCRVWGLSYSGSLTVTTGQNAATQTLADQCFDLSNNFITVTRQLVDGGTVALDNGETTATVCAADGIADLLTFEAQTSSALNYSFVVTDDQNVILAVLDGNSLDFDVAVAGVCRVWGLSYAGSIIAEAGDNAATTTLADGCFDLSDNFIEVTRIVTDGGTVALADGNTAITVCVGDGLADVLSFNNTTSSSEAYAFIITDDNNNVIGVADGNSQDFEGAGAGVCRVWGLSYSGNLSVTAGEFATAQNLSDQCFDLSDDYITVNRDLVDGGTVALVGGGTTAAVCSGDGIADELSFEAQTAATQSYSFIVTDDQNNILVILDGNTIDFDVAGQGICSCMGIILFRKYYCPSRRQCCHCALIQWLF